MKNRGHDHHLSPARVGYPRRLSLGSHSQAGASQWAEPSQSARRCSGTPSTPRGLGTIAIWFIGSPGGRIEQAAWQLA